MIVLRHNRGRDLRSCSMVTDSPGARTVKERAFVLLAALLGTYLTFAPMKLGLSPESVVMSKVLAGSVCRAPRGSLRSLRVSSPVLVSVVATFRFWTSSTASGPVTLRERPGVAETAVAVATRATSAARRVAENMLLTVSRSGGAQRGQCD